MDRLEPQVTLVPTEDGREISSQLISAQDSPIAVGVSILPKTRHWTLETGATQTSFVTRAIVSPGLVREVLLLPEEPEPPMLKVRAIGKGTHYLRRLIPAKPHCRGYDPTQLLDPPKIENWEKSSLGTAISLRFKERRWYVLEMRPGTESAEGAQARCLDLNQHSIIIRAKFPTITSGEKLVIHRIKILDRFAPFDRFEPTLRSISKEQDISLGSTDSEGILTIVSPPLEGVLRAHPEDDNDFGTLLQRFDTRKRIRKIVIRPGAASLRGKVLIDLKKDSRSTLLLFVHGFDPSEFIAIRTKQSRAILRYNFGAGVLIPIPLRPGKTQLSPTRLHAHRADGSVPRYSVSHISTDLDEPLRRLLVVTSVTSPRELDVEYIGANKKNVIVRGPTTFDLNHGQAHYYRIEGGTQNGKFRLVTSTDKRIELVLERAAKRPLNIYSWNREIN